MLPFQSVILRLRVDSSIISLNRFITLRIRVDSLLNLEGVLLYVKCYVLYLFIDRGLLFYRPKLTSILFHHYPYSSYRLKDAPMSFSIGRYLCLYLQTLIRLLFSLKRFIILRLKIDPSTSR